MVMVLFELMLQIADEDGKLVQLPQLACESEGSSNTIWLGYVTMILLYYGIL